MQTPLITVTGKWHAYFLLQCNTVSHDHCWSVDGS